MSSTTADLLLDCPSVSRGKVVCQKMQSRAPDPFFREPDPLCPLLDSSLSDVMPAVAPAMQQWLHVVTQLGQLALTALLAINAGLMLCVLRRRERRAATAAAFAVPAAAEACRPIKPADVIKPLFEDNEPCVRRRAPATVQMCSILWHVPGNAREFCAHVHTGTAWSTALARTPHAAGAPRRRSQQHQLAFRLPQQQLRSAAAVVRYDSSWKACTSLTLRSTHM